MPNWLGAGGCPSGHYAKLRNTPCWNSRFTFNFDLRALGHRGPGAALLVDEQGARRLWEDLAEGLLWARRLSPPGGSVKLVLMSL